MRKFFAELTKKQKKMLLRIVVSVLLTLLLTVVLNIIPLNEYVSLILFLIPYLVIGYDVLLKAARNIVGGSIFDEKFLMTIATAGAFFTGDYREACAVMIFYQLGELFENIAVGRTRKSIAAIMDIRPDYANVIRDGEEQRVSPDEVFINDIIVIKPGERVPLDGVVLEGISSLNTAALTGEALPVDIVEGDSVISGAININGVIKVRVTSDYSGSTVSKILELVENASDKKARVEGFVSRFAKYYTPVVVILAVLLALVPPLILHSGWGEWIHRALIFLVVSCPCALVVSVPLTFFCGIGCASREGILVKGSNYLELLSKVTTVVFDKTGTLTKGVFEVEAIHPEESKYDLFELAAIAESKSNHPIALSIVRAYGKKGKEPDKSRLGTVEEIAGKGIKAEIDGEDVFVGNGALMELSGARFHECHKTGTILHVSVSGRYLGHIVINDEIKPESSKAVSELARDNIKTVMLTGDKKDRAEEIGKELGINEVYSDLLPQDKVVKVEELIADPASTIAFVGDGINDAPALMRSDVGIAMGALGSDAAVEASDVVLMNDNPLALPLAVVIARRTMRIVKENIVFALAVKVLILVLGAIGVAGMWVAVFGDVGVLIIAVLNALRAFKVKH
ncbi:MAG: cadmium-translocating P-type ATPase [Clostridia bacterium]|nr:cadmium-translocating P-type ATPase [Clostridia bacterium]